MVWSLEFDVCEEFMFSEDFTQYEYFWFSNSCFDPSIHLVFKDVEMFGDQVLKELLDSEIQLS